ncbi:hypothetical protein ACUN9Y_12995 [Halomonas sp. V046]|uniref:hypothetical protein n=1 Tax=Halomonas sp. V046 TaxID=3459611 RepID=UPI0040441AB8
MMGPPKILVLMLSLLLLACDGGSQDTPAQETRVGGVAEPRSASPNPGADAVSEADPLDEAVDVALDAEVGADRRMTVRGTTNLPDDTRIQVLVTREASGFRWQIRTQVAQGRFAAGPFGSGSGLPDGGYQVRVNMAPVDVQPDAVRARLGEQGKHLSGPLVTQSEHGLGQVISASKRFLIGREPRRTADDVEVLERP